MELHRLYGSGTDSLLKTAFKPEIVVDNHSSLVWTERYFQEGDFVRESYDIEGTLRNLPITDEYGAPVDTIVALSDSIVPMVVEGHKISKSLHGPPMITTTGRSLETVLERRTTLSRVAKTGVWGDQPKQVSTMNESMTTNAPPAPWVVKANSAARAAAHVVEEILSQPEDAMPDVMLNFPEAVFPVKQLLEHQVTPGNLYEWFREQLRVDEVSLMAKIIPDWNIPAVVFDAYVGRDRTNSVAFDVEFDQFTSSEYILSNAWYRNVSQVFGENGSVEVDNGTVLSGMAKRISFTDQSQVAKSGVDSVDSVASATALTNLLKGLGIVDLKRQTQTVLFSGELAQQIATKYDSMRNRESDPSTYYLGDKVALRGDYGLSRFVRIAEFIRSEDSSGSSAYPTFASINAEV